MRNISAVMLGQRREQQEREEKKKDNEVRKSKCTKSEEA